MNTSITRQEETPARSVTAADTACVSAPSRSPPRVLFVDDEPAVLEGIRLGLRKQRYEIRTSTRADVALEMQREQPFDVIVTDECMPGMHGSELLTVIAREFPTVGRIVLTGHATVEVAAGAINRAGVIRFLLKPCAPEELQEAIEAALAARLPGAAAARSAVREGFRIRRRRARRGEADSEITAIRDITTHRPAQRIVTHTSADMRAAALLQGMPAADELVLYAQKVVSLKRPAAALGYELLTRVQMRGGRLLTLPEYVSSGHAQLLLPSLDRWVVQHILEMLHGRSRTLRRSGLTISLNVAAGSVADVDFVQFLRGELRRSGTAERILVEIPQHAAVESLKSGGRLLRSFCKSGCRLCIDGVGPDLKPLAALRHLPIALVKLDGLLVRAVLTDPDARSAVRAIAELARAAGITTAAKFVETTALAEHLRSLGVQLGQGYAFGPPEPAARVLAAL